MSYYEMKICIHFVFGCLIIIVKPTLPSSHGYTNVQLGDFTHDNALLGHRLFWNWAFAQLWKVGGLAILHERTFAKFGHIS
jgi:hypothetical protein